jgi:hypothetical protein
MPNTPPAHFCTLPVTGLPVIARLKENLPELAASVTRRFDSQTASPGAPAWTRPHRVLGGTRLCPVGDLALGAGPCPSLSSAPSQWNCRRGRIAHQSILQQGTQSVAFPHGAEPMGDRKRGIRGLQVAPRAGTYLPSPYQQPADLLAAHPTGSGAQQTLPRAFPASRKPFRGFRHRTRSPALARSRIQAPLPLRLARPLISPSTTSHPYKRTLQFTCPNPESETAGP